MTHQPAEEMNQMASVWPFMQWGIDLIGPFKWAKGNDEYLVVAINYFTKWIKKKATFLDHRGGHKGFCMEEHYMQVWHPTHYHLR